MGAGSAEDGRFVGDCGLTWQEVEGRDELEIGYHVRVAGRGKGFAAEAAEACLDHGFAVLGAAHVCSIVLPDNTASCAVARRIHAHWRGFDKRGEEALLFDTDRADWTPAEQA